jgi:hypothetical protein
MILIVITGQAQEWPMAQGARRKGKQSIRCYLQPCTLDRVPSVGLPGATMRRKVPFKWLRTTLIAAWKKTPGLLQLR